MSGTIGVDWSEKRFRAWRFDARGRVLDRRESRDGLRRAAKRGHDRTLLRQVGGWLESGTTIVVSSALPDRRGWIETPLRPAPLDVDALLDGAVHHRLEGATVLVLPGVRSRAGDTNDVMGREALLAIGATRTASTGQDIGRGTGRDRRRLVVVPGARSRWMRVADGRVEAFRTSIGGELLDQLLDGPFGRELPAGGASDGSAFLDGVEQGYRSRHVVTDLFSVRATALLDERDPDDSRARLSGLVIGNEIREAEIALEATGEALTLIGEGERLDAWARALRHLGTSVARDDVGAAAVAGFDAVREALARPPHGMIGRVVTTGLAPLANTASPMRTPRDWDDAFDELPLLGFLPALDARRVVGTATTLIEAGFRLLVVSMRNAGPDGAETTDAVATVRRLARAFGTRACIGVRDVSTLAEADAAIEAGARVVVANDADAALARHCVTRGVPWVPGVTTVTEATRAHALGARALLLYPADTLEPRAVRTLRRTLSPDTSLIPAGGLEARTLLPYAAAGADGVAADDTLVDPRASRTDGVAAARTFVRTWRRIARGRRTLAANAPVAPPRPDPPASPPSVVRPIRSSMSASRDPED